ncbi:MAG: NAD(P)-dependent oxidoreductase [Candidatus Hodarchaeota archaeon]
MKDLKIAFFEMEDWKEKYLRDNLQGHELVFYSEELDAENADKVKDVEGISFFVFSKLDEAALSKLPNLKLVATRTTGFDHIDVKECEKRNIVVCNVPFYGDNTVAEHAFALLLTLTRKMHKVSMTEHKTFPMEGLKGIDLKGKTFGVVGAGRIGLYAAKFARGFGMDVLAYDIIFNDFAREVLWYKYVSLEELLKNSDIISIHAPYNKYTHHMINKDNIRLIKRDAILINTSRGGLIDTDALKMALDEGIISAAGLDVIEGEDLIIEETKKPQEKLTEEEKRIIERNLSIVERENVVFTPHVAFNTQEAEIRILDTTIANIQAYVKGRPQNVVKLITG